MELHAPSVDNKSLCLLPIPFTSNFPLICPPVSAVLIFHHLSFSALFCLLQRRRWRTLTCPVSRKRPWGTLRLTASGAWANCWTASRCVHLSERSQARSFVVSNYLATSTKRVKHFSNPEHTRGQLKISSERKISISVFIHFNVVNLNHLKSKWRVFWCLCCCTACKASLTAWAWCIKQLLCVGFRKREGKKMVVLHILKLEEGLESS